MASASCSTVSVESNSSFAATSSWSGPRCSVRRWMMRRTVGAPSRACAIAVTSAGDADSPISRPFISIASRMAMTTSRKPMASEPTASQRGLPVTWAREHADEGEHEADQGAGVLEQHDRQLGLLGAADPVQPAPGRRAVGLGLLVGGAQGPALEHHGEQRGSRWPPAAAPPRAGGAASRCPRRWRTGRPSRTARGRRRTPRSSARGRSRTGGRCRRHGPPACRRAAGGAGCPCRPASGRPRRAARPTR